MRKKINDEPMPKLIEAPKNYENILRTFVGQRCVFCLCFVCVEREKKPVIHFFLFAIINKYVFLRQKFRNHKSKEETGNGMVPFWAVVSGKLLFNRIWWFRVRSLLGRGVAVQKDLWGSKESIYRFYYFL